VALIQIEESELATLRRERDEAKAKVDQLANENRDLTTKAETAEAAQKRAEDETAAVKQELTKAQETAQATALRDKRMTALGAGFMAKLGETSKHVLNELAAKASDEEWDNALKEREELAQVKRDAAAEGNGTPPSGGGTQPPPSSGTSFSSDEVAAFMRSPVAPAPSGGTPAQNGATSVRQLARAFGKKTPAGAGK
jgi:hypothetical protein